MKYRIADLIVDMQPTGRLVHQSEKYQVTTVEQSEFTIDYGNLEQFNSKNRNYSFEEFQYLTSGSDFYRKLLDYNGMMLHASCVVVDDKAYLFSAACGTGKSTHTSLWLELFKEKAKIINDDKPAIRKIDGKYYAYGTPWSGKCDLSENTKAEIQGICFLQRDSCNWIKKLDPQTSIIRIIHAALKKLSADQVEKQLSIIYDIMDKVPIYLMGCTPTIEAAKTAYEGMSGCKIAD